jgi:hypothetical protein
MPVDTPVQVEPGVSNREVDYTFTEQGDRGFQYQFGRTPNDFAKGSRWPSEQVPRPAGPQPFINLKN